MSDPAIEAAHRAFPDVSRLVIPTESPFDIAVAAVREALKPIREMHRKEDDGSRWPKCPECRYDWPCATAYLVYADDELNRESK